METEHLSTKVLSIGRLFFMPEASVGYWHENSSSLTPPPQRLFLGVSANHCDNHSILDFLNMEYNNRIFIVGLFFWFNLFFIYLFFIEMLYCLVLLLLLLLLFFKLLFFFFFTICCSGNIFKVDKKK